MLDQTCFEGVMCSKKTKEVLVVRMFLRLRRFVASVKYMDNIRVKDDH